MTTDKKSCRCVPTRWLRQIEWMRWLVLGASSALLLGLIGKVDFRHPFLKENSYCKVTSYICPLGDTASYLDLDLSQLIPFFLTLLVGKYAWNSAQIRKKLSEPKV